jgi:hypothetical protein
MGQHFTAFLNIRVDLGDPTTKDVTPKKGLGFGGMGTTFPFLLHFLLSLIH